MKKILSFVLVIIMLCSAISIPVLAEETVEISQMQIDDIITITVDGVFIDCFKYGQIPVIVEGRTLVPLRSVFEALGAEVSWNNEERSVTSIKDDVTITLKVDSMEMLVNGEIKTLDVPAQIMNERTMVPVRAVAEAFDCIVEWNNSERWVVITTTSENELYCAEQTVLNMYNAVHRGMIFDNSNYSVDGAGIKGLGDDIGFMSIIMSTVGVYTGNLSEELQERYSNASAHLLMGLFESVDCEIISSEKIDENLVEVTANVYVVDVAQIDLDEISNTVTAELDRQMKEEYGFSVDEADENNEAYLNEYNIRGFEIMFSMLAEIFPKAQKKQIENVVHVVEKINGRWLIVE